MSNSDYSLEKKLKKHCARKVLRTSTWAELTVSVNSTLSRLSGEELDSYMEPEIVLLSNKEIDLFQLLVVSLITEEKNVKYLLKRAISENPTFRNSAFLQSVLDEDHLKLYLLELVNSRGIEHLYSVLNLKTARDNKKSILTLLKFKRKSLGTKRNQLPEKRRIGVGYRDKGSLPEAGAKEFRAANVLEYSFQERIYENRQRVKDTSDFIRGLLC